MTPTLAFHNVSFAYPDRAILRSASFSLASGTATALIGPNGVGKTTILRLAAGVLRPRDGGISLSGIPLDQLSIREAARIVAMVPQSLEIPFDFSVEQVVEQGRSPYLSFLGGIRREDRYAIDRAFAMAAASSLRRRMYNELSGGEKQRVKIALALAQEPRVLLLDEPTQNLDIARQAELLRLLEDLRGSGLSILAAIHDLHLIPGSFSQVIVLAPGRPPEVGPPERMLSGQRLAATFGCTAPHPYLTLGSYDHEYRDQTR